MGTPNGRCFPSGLGIYTRRTGQWSIRSTLQFFRQFVQPSLHPILLDVLEALTVHSCRSAIGFAAFIGKRQNVLPVHLVVQRVETKAGRFLRFVVQRRLQLLNTYWGLLGSSPIPPSFVASCVSFQLRPLPSTGITRLPRYYGPLRHPIRPGLALTSCQLIPSCDHRWGFPCCVWSPMSACRRHYPGRIDGTDSLILSIDFGLPRITVGRLLHYPFRGLLSVHSRYSLQTRQVALSDPLHRRLQQLRYLHCCSDCYRVERTSSRAGLSPAVDQRLSRRTVIAWLQQLSGRMRLVRQDSQGECCSRD